MSYIPEPDQLEVKTTPEALTLITNEGGKTTIALCQALLDRGHQVKVLSFPESLLKKKTQVLPAAVEEIILPDISDDTIKRIISQIATPIANFIHLHPHLRFPLGNLGLQFEKEKNLLKSVFLLAKHLKAPLNTLAEQHRTAFLTVSRLDGALGTQNPGNVSPNGGGLFGLSKSLNIEWPKVFCRGVDIAPEINAAAVAEKIVQELYDADQSLTDTAHHKDGKRYRLWARAVDSIPTENLSASIHPNSVFLVTGGARGVTADCVKQMAKSFKCKFILLGRSELQQTEAKWAQGVQEVMMLKRKAMEALKAKGEKPLPKTVQRMVNKVLAQREIEENLAFIRSQGSEVFYQAVDVTDAQALKAAVNQISPQTGNITGIIHGAGRLADKLIQDKTEADFEAVYEVKVQGLLAAIQAVSIHDIQHVVLFSSVAGFYGNRGQTDYAIANEVLNKIAHLFHKNHPDVQVISINWGAWDAGMVSPALKKIFEAHHIPLVPTTEGPIAMVDQLSTNYSDQVQVILGATLPMLSAATDGPLTTYVIHRRLREESNPFLTHHVIQGNAVLPIVHASAWMAQTVVDLYPGFHLYKVEKAKLFKGIVFDGKQAENYQLRLKELEKSETHIRVQVMISSDSGAKLPTNHYQAVVNLMSKAPEAPIEQLPNLNQIIPLQQEASSIYTDGTLFHGKDFQGVKQVLELNEEGLLLLCEHQGVELARQGQFPVKAVNAFLTDIMYQGLLIWVRKYHGAACLPLRTEWSEVFESLPFGKAFYVSLKVLKSDEFDMEADLTAFDAESGQVYMKSHRAGVTISRDLKWA